LSTGRIILVTLLAGMLSVVAGLLGHRYLNPPGPGSATHSLVPQPLQTVRQLPEFSLRDVSGETLHSTRWNGKVLVLNFWATWCPPCLQEIPRFVQLQQELGPRGLQFVGIAVDDPQAVQAYAAGADVNYPLLLGDESSIELSRQLGNRFQALPFSAIFDRNGRLLYTQTGQLTVTTIREQIASAL
jgi:thiol-disulfide isomerase/thioredoxin